MNPNFLTLCPVRGCFFNASRQTDGSKCQIAVVKKSVASEEMESFTKKFRLDLAAMGRFLARE